MSFILTLRLRQDIWNDAADDDDDGGGDGIGYF